MSTSGCSIPTSSSQCIILTTQTSSGEQVDPKSTDKSFKDIVDIGSIEFNPEIVKYLSQKDHFLEYVDHILKNFNI
tara:strand:- start:2208 stop:2435 length:228 start_codon:yes stop_codon:yes gene_type:complete